MPTLAPKLPWNHPFAGGYPRLGGQPLPTDPDAIDYLERVAAADGAAVEVGVAMAVDSLVKGLKDSGIWDAIKASCLLCGPRTLSGALTSLKSYGDELWTANSPSISNDSGSTGNWNAETQTVSDLTGGGNASYPRFTWLSLLQAGRSYRVQGRVSGDIAAIAGLRLGSSGAAVPIDPSTGAFDSVKVAATNNFEIFLNGTLGPSSVTIESLSIREYFANPTNVANAFVEGDYNRVTGLKGDGSTTYLDTGRAGNADGQNDIHGAAYITGGITTTNGRAFGVGSGAAGDNLEIYRDGAGGMTFRCNTVSVSSAASQGGAVGFVGVNRQSSASFDRRIGETTTSVGLASVASSSQNVAVFAGNEAGVIKYFSNARLAFYSIGAALSLESLDTRISAYVAAIAAAL